MSHDDDIFARLCAAAGIHASHSDAFGQKTAPSRAACAAILRDFGLPEGGREAQAYVSAREAALAPDWAAVESDAPGMLHLPRAAAGEPVEYVLTCEGGAVLAGRAVAGAAGALPLPPAPSGYHRLTLRQGGAMAEMTLLAAPPRCFEPGALAGEARLWGVSAQAYGLRTPASQGIGDFSDMAELAGRAAALGADFVGLSPAHALFQANRAWISPYSPSSRLFLDPIYLDLSAVEGASPADAAALAGLRAAKLIDHAAVWRLKLPVLEAAWAQAQSNPTPEFPAFRDAGGEALRRFGIYEALFEHFAAEGKTWLRAWPAAFQECASPSVEDFARKNAERVQFHLWLQWLCDRQLGQAQTAARGAGMALGLYRDLAVGAERGGAEIWAAPGAHAATLSIGAPPDRLAPQGQNWGLPPLDPLRLAQTGFAAFRAPAAANMRHAGALRIDHAFQLSRLFLIPQGVAPGDGAYVDYPLEAMLAVLRIESHRARCAVIAEDLGTAPPGFSQRLMDSGISGCCVVPFERGHDGFKAPRDYPRQALAMSATHDLPTFIGWWRGTDIDWRHDLEIFDFVATLGAHAARRKEIAEFAAALHREGLLDAPEPPAEPPLAAAMAFLARTRAALAALQLEDAAGEAEQANLPGTVSGHPNWRRRLPLDLEELFAPDGPMAKLAAIFKREGRGRG